MTEYFTEDQALAMVLRLTPEQLAAFVAAGAIVPGGEGRVFVAGDLARLHLLCEFAEVYDMGPEALAMVMGVIDQMHAARRDRDALLAAIRAEAREVHERVMAVLVRGSMV